MDTKGKLTGAVLATALAVAGAAPASATVATAVPSTASFSMDANGNLLVAGMMADTALRQAYGSVAADLLNEAADTNGCCNNPGCTCPPAKAQLS